MKKKKGGFLVGFIIVILCITSLLVGGYFLLDKSVVPKYFGEYGINNMNELVGMMKTLYSSPDENKLIKNKFSTLDLESAEEKLKTVFPTKENSTVLDYNSIADGVAKEGVEFPLVLEFSDREIASVVDEMLNKGVLAKKLPYLEYINTLKINVLDLIIMPEVPSSETNPEKVQIHAIFKVDSTGIREQMAHEMGINMFLLNMIIPDTIYLTTEYTLELIDDAWTYVDGNVSVNGRSAKQSEILLNLLISFIFPVEDEMDLEKLTIEFGNILQYGLDFIGQVEYTKNGIIITAG